MHKICIVTGTRAEYGLLKPLIEKVSESNKAELMLVVTGTHLSRKFGHTVDVIEQDGFDICARIDLELGEQDALSVANESEAAAHITDSMAIAIREFGRFFSKNNPDIVVLLGDRYETLMVATAAMMNRIPIAHLHGGEITEGVVDDAIRHSITKMSHLHFASTEGHRNRIIQLGEAADRVFNVGAPGVENVLKLKCLEDEELWNNLGRSFEDGRKLAVMTYHPETLGTVSAVTQIEELLAFLDNHPEINVVITGANADCEGGVINNLLEKYAKENSERCSFFMSLGQLRYFSLLKKCSFVIGNSSSGIIEVPSFRIPTINIGDRQKGRTRAKSVVDCSCDRASIEEAYKVINDNNFSEALKNMNNPYEGDSTSERIYEIIIDNLNQGIDIQKKFVDIH